MKTLEIKRNNRNLRIVLNRKDDKVNFIEIGGYDIKGKSERVYYFSKSIKLTKEEIKKIKELFNKS